MAYLAPLMINEADGGRAEATRYDLLPGERCFLLRSGRPLCLQSQQWAEGRFLVCDVAYMAPHHSRLQLRFVARGEEEPRLAVTFGFIPGLKSRLCFDFRHLDAQTLFLPRTPGRLKATCLGRRIDPREIGRVELLLEDSDHDQWCFVTTPYLRTDQPFCKVPRQILVDELGQLADREWEGKQHSPELLVASLRAERSTGAASPPADRDLYGGCPTIRFEASGFFTTRFDRGRWWLVDPAGNAFFSAGLDSVRDSESAAVVPGTEELYAWLPRRNGDYGDCLGEHVASATPTVRFGRTNLRRAFGDDWFEAWCDLTAQRLRRWGFNTVGNWSDVDFARRAGLPYVRNLVDYPATGLRLYRDLPDVFDPAFAEAARTYAQQLADSVDDRLLIGYFMANEPQWAFGETNLASEMLEAHPGSHSRRALARFVAARHEQDPAACSRAWGLQLESFADLEERCFHRLADSHPGAADDLWAFSKLLARRYVEAPAQELRKVDPNHLNLGLRFAWLSSELCFEVAREFDVFSLNCYQMQPDLEAVERVQERCNLPVLIGEFHFGALDRGLLGTGLRAVADQRQRGVAYRAYVEACAAHPGVVGCHYFTLNDQAALGRFDGECWQIGFVDVCQQPYRELANAAALTHGRLYDVRSGRLPPYAGRAEERVRIAF